MTDNELIAEFYCKQLNIEGAGLVENHYYFGTVPVTYAYRGNLKFDTSWDWLMPVVEKIKGLTSTQNEYYGRVVNALFTVNIENVYKAVVEFIKWYNDRGARN